MSVSGSLTKLSICKGSKTKSCSRTSNFVLLTFFFKLNDQTNSEITSSYVIKEENNRIKELLISLKNKFSKTQIQF